MARPKKGPFTKPPCSKGPFFRRSKKAPQNKGPQNRASKTNTPYRGRGHRPRNIDARAHHTEGPHNRVTESTPIQGTIHRWHKNKRPRGKAPHEAGIRGNTQNKSGPKRTFYFDRLDKSRPGQLLVHFFLLKAEGSL